MRQMDEEAKRMCTKIMKTNVCLQRFGGCVYNRKINTYKHMYSDILKF